MFNVQTSAIGTRVDLPCALAGFTPPPCRVHLKFVPAGDRWTMLARTPVDKPMAIARWLQGQHPVQVEMGPGLAPKILRAEFDTLPEPWAQIVKSLPVHHMDITPDGTVSLFIEGGAEKVNAFLAGLQAGQSVRARESATGPNQVKITQRQLDALNTAVALGYYDIPHRIDLRQLAVAMNMSLGSVSELLRRAERAVVTSFADSWAISQWTNEETQWQGVVGFAGGPTEVNGAWRAAAALARSPSVTQ